MDGICVIVIVTKELKENREFIGLGSGAYCGFARASKMLSKKNYRWESKEGSGMFWLMILLVVFSSQSQRKELLEKYVEFTYRNRKRATFYIGSRE